MQTVPALPLQQHPNFAAALRLMGRQVDVVQLPGAAPVQTIQRFGLRFAPRAPIWTGANPTVDALRGADLHLINSDGGDHVALRRAGFRQVMTPACVAELSLDGTPEDRVMRTNGKWRNALRKGQRSGLVVSRQFFDAKRHQWLLDADRDQQRTKRFRGLPHSVICAYGAANPKSVLVFTAQSDAETVAAMLFLIHGTTATYHLGWSNPDGRKLVAHHVLLMRAADVLAMRHVTRIDLGGVDTVNAPGLARFKIGSGAAVRPLGGTWLRIPGL